MMYYYRCPHCEGKAFYMLRHPVEGEPIVSEDARHLDGSRVQPGSLIYCESCDRRIDYLLVSRVVEVSDEIPQGED